MKKPLFFILLFPLLQIVHVSNAQEVITLREADEAFALVMKHANINDLHRDQLKLAELTVDAARLNIFNPRIPVQGSMINNTNLPVNFIPAEFFGGPAGTFREITFGQPYITSMNIAPQFDIIHLGKWKEMDVSEQNLSLVQAQQQNELKTLKEQVYLWFIDALAWKMKCSAYELSVKRADSLVHIVQAKFKLGIAREQEVNDALINWHQQQNLYTSSSRGLEQSMLVMKSWCSCEVTLDLDTTAMHELTEVQHGSSEVKVAEAQLGLAVSQLSQSKFDQLPVLSFQSSLAWQNNSSDRYFDPANRWVYSTFIGAKLSWDFPTNTQKITQLQSRKINVDLAKTKLKEEERLQQLKSSRASIEIANAKSQSEEMRFIRDLEVKNLSLNKALYAGDQIALDRLIASQQKTVLSELNYNLAIINQYHSILKANLYAE